MKKKLNKVIIFVILILLSTVFVSAVSEDLLTIPYCYNVSVHYSQAMGNKSPVTFNGCVDIGNHTWTCDCHNVLNTTVNIVTDSAVLPDDNSDQRLYRLNVTYNTYTLESWEDDFVLHDWGDHAWFNHENYDMGQNVVIVEKPVLVNNTVYVDRVVNNIVNNTLIVNHNVSVVFENVSRLDVVKHSRTKWVLVSIASWILLFGAAYLLVIWYWRFRWLLRVKK